MSEHKRSPIQLRRARNVAARSAIAALFCIALATTVGCGSTETSTQDVAETSGAADVPEYALRGKVVQLEPENQAATIEHQEITGWMDAMTMRFPIKDRADFDKLAVGAEIEATVFVGADGFHVGNVKVISGGDGDQQP